MQRAPSRRAGRVLLPASAVLVLSLVLTLSHPEGARVLRVSVGTGGAGGVYQVYGDGLAEVTADFPNTEISTQVTGASVENLELVARGELDAAFTLADVAALSVEGEAPFDEPLDNHTHVVVRDGSPYEEVADLEETPVSVGAPGSGTEMMAERLLHSAGAEGVDRRRLPIEDSAEALAEGRIEAFVWSGGLPTRAVADLAEETPIRLLDLAQHVPDLVAEHGEYFSELAVPAHTYPGVPAVRTIGVPSLLVVGAHMPDDDARDLTRVLFESRSELTGIHPVALHLDTRSAIATLPVPLHPGATRYYRSVKYAHDPWTVTAPPGT
ncbi:TAXI family TRAP transporter solute-binding subunit [Nocardiopsis salina]|uniref:TAXI family TRAP transporter solute-binding subunit n=1 Tax=Nocardiopsis salina TaxID=245836 RepID=UPI00036A989C|nr:TAXI family TRAP transporter solute-binding subunit [Nocardiopsis salina]